MQSLWTARDAATFKSDLGLFHVTKVFTTLSFDKSWRTSCYCMQLNRPTSIGIDSGDFEALKDYKSLFTTLPRHILQHSTIFR